MKLYNKNEKGIITLEASIIAPIIIGILSIIISLMVKYVSITVESSENAESGTQICDSIDETETDMLLKTIYDFLEVLTDE